MSAADRASWLKTAAVFDFMRERRITLDDLINVGGEDKSPKARKVEDAWALMARLGVVFADLEAVADRGQRSRLSGPPHNVATSPMKRANVPK